RLSVTRATPRQHPASSHRPEFTMSPDNARSGRLLDVYREVLADLETPLTAYLKIAGHPAFLLESVEQGERVARYSFIGTGARRTFEARCDQMSVTTPAGRRTFTTADPLATLWDEVVRDCVPEP